MAKRQPPSIKRPTLEYFAYRGPNRVAIGDLAPAGMPGLIFAPTSGRRCPIVAFGHGWLQSADRYSDTMRYLASWGIIVVAPNTHRSLFSSHQGLGLDLSRALRMVAYGELGAGRVRGDLRRMGVIGHSTGGGAAVLAAARDDQIKAVVTVTAAETKPSAVEAAGTGRGAQPAPDRVEGRLGRIRRREDRAVLGRARAAADGQGHRPFGARRGQVVHQRHPGS